MDVSMTDAAPQPSAAEAIASDTQALAGPLQAPEMSSTATSLASQPVAQAAEVAEAKTEPATSTAMGASTTSVVPDAPPSGSSEVAMTNTTLPQPAAKTEAASSLAPESEHVSDDRHISHATVNGMSMDETKSAVQEQASLSETFAPAQEVGQTATVNSATAPAATGFPVPADVDMKEADASIATERSIKKELIDESLPDAATGSEQSQAIDPVVTTHTHAADEQAAKTAANLIESIESAKATVASTSSTEQPPKPATLPSATIASASMTAEPSRIPSAKKETFDGRTRATTPAAPQPLPTASNKARTPPFALTRAAPSDDRRASSRVPVSAPSHASIPVPAPMSASSRSRQDELAQMQRESDEMRLMWLSLPSNDHPSYYSDTDEDGASSSSSAANAYNPGASTAQTAYLNRKSLGHDMRKRQRNGWYEQEDDEEYDSQDEDLSRLLRQEETMYNHGNRGKKLRKSSRWIRQGKLGQCSEVRTEKEIHERFTDRVKALQRQNVESMLHNAQGPAMPEAERDMLDGSDRTLLRDLDKSLEVDENSMMLAPQLLRPIMSARALLQSHTLRHTFRNPHLVALSRTALDLRESENTLGRSLSRCFGAIERAAGPLMNGVENGDAALTNGRTTKRTGVDPHAIGVEGTHGTEDELNPAFAQLDRLFVTKEGLPIPLGASSDDEQMNDVTQEGEDGSGHAVLSAGQQRDVVRAALECLHELGADSLEYVERLDEVRTRLTAVKRKRTEVWNALRLWALKRDGDTLEGLTDPSGGSLGMGKDAVEAAKASAAAVENAATRGGAGAAASVAAGGASGATSGKTGSGGISRSAKRQRER